jgi:methyl-accepting chemotaxis protein
MKLHTKLSLAILSGLIIIVLVAQYFQYRGANTLISGFAEETLQTLRQREEQAVRNLFLSVARSVSGSLERGEMEKFTKLLEDQRKVEGLLEFSLYNNEGVVTYSSDPSFLKKSLSDELRQRLLAKAEQMFRYANNAAEIYQPQVVVPDCIRCHQTWQVGSICGITSMRFSTEALTKAENQTAVTKMKGRQTFQSNAGFTLLGIVVVFVVLMYLSVNQFVRHPLTLVIEGLRDIAEGEGDLTKRLKLISKDELGTLAQLFNTFLEKLQTLIKQIQQSGIQIVSSATQLAATAREQEAIMANQVQTTDKVLKSVEEISQVTENLVQTMRGVASVSDDTTDLASQEQTDLARMETAMHNMEHASQTISTRLATINEKAENITAVVTTITKVADQTNLLSLNAAIEAEKAGEYGRGFTVVAREIRRLADQTAISTLDIEQMVREMQSAVSSGVMEMDKFIAEVGHNVEDVGRISAKLLVIIRQVQSLAPNFEAVNVAMTNLSEETQETKTSLDETYSAIEQLNEAARGLQAQVSRFKVA